MKPKITNMIGIAAVVGLAIWVAFEHQRRTGLEREHQALQQQLAEMGDLVASNEQLSKLMAQSKSPRFMTDDQSRELLRLRGQAGVLRQQNRELETVREENRQARAGLESSLRNPSAATADYWPKDSWAFKGFATADAALQSSLWAANNGDMKALLASATGEMQKMMAEDLKGKSETEASIRMMDEVTGMKSVRVVNREVQGDDTSVLTIGMDGRNGPETQKLVMKKVGNEWKISGPAP